MEGMRFTRNRQNMRPSGSCSLDKKHGNFVPKSLTVSVTLKFQTGVRSGYEN